MPSKNRKTSICSEHDLFVPLTNSDPSGVSRRRPQAKYIEESNYKIEMMHKDEDCLADLSPQKKENIRTLGFKKEKEGSPMLTEPRGKENMVNHSW